MTITKENREGFIGVTVDCNRRLHHYYPLTIRERGGQYYYVDATGTWVCFNDRDAIYYDAIIKPAETEGKK